VGKRRPKSGGGGTGPDSPTGPDDPHGRGDYDAATGLWDWYERPEDTGTPVTWEEILTHHTLIVADFASEYGIRLHRDPPSWAEFRDLVHGLLQTESRLWRALRPDDEPTQQGE
jgi:hypothetical protein